MTTRLTSRDFEMLSTYLDGQLTNSERAYLESRLQVEKELQTTLEEMRRTRAVLRAAPVLRAPRNYTLKPEMVKIRRQTTSAYPILRLASVVASILFVLAFAGDLISRGISVQAPAAIVQEGAAINTEILDEVAATEQALMQSKAPPAPAAELAQETLPDQVATETATAPMLQMEMMAASPVATEVVGAPSPEAGATLRQTPETLSRQTAVQSETEDQTESTKPTSSGWLNSLRVFEIIILVCAIVTGLGAVFVRRRG